MVFKAYFIDRCEKFVPGISQTAGRPEISTASAAGGEHVSWQVVIEALEDVSGISVVFGAFKNDAEPLHQACVSSQEILSVLPVSVPDHQENTDNMITDKPGLFPDRLVKTKSIFLKKGEFHTLYLTADLLGSAEAGDFTSSVCIFSSATEKVTLTAKLHIFDFELKKYDFDMLRHISLSNIERFHHAVPGSPRFLEAVDSLASLMRKYGETLPILPWFEMYAFSENADGTINIDSSLIKTIISIFKKHGYNKFVFKHIGWRAGWGARQMLGFKLRYTSADGTSMILQPTDFFDEKYQRFFRAHLTEVRNIIKGDRDGTEYITHMFDEVLPRHYEILSKAAHIIREICPELKTIEAVRENSPESCELLDYSVFIWGSELEIKNKIGGKFMWYICMEPRGPNPTHFIGQKAVNYRAAPWLLWKYGIEGFLEYGGNCYSEGIWDIEATTFDPRVTACFSPDCIAPGDGYLVYPDDEKYFMPSLRIELFKLGQEEYRYLRMLDQLSESGDEEAQSLRREADSLLGAHRPYHVPPGTQRVLVGETYGYSLEPSDYDAMKEKIGTLLEARLGRSK